MLCQHTANATKPQFLLCLPPMSVISLILGHAPKNDIKLFCERAERTFPHKSCLKIILVLADPHFGGVKTSLGWLLGVTWPAFGLSWAALGLSWPLLGRILGASTPILGPSCLIWDGLSSPNTSRVVIWDDLGVSRTCGLLTLLGSSSLLAGCLRALSLHPVGLVGCLLQTPV